MNFISDDIDLLQKSFSRAKLVFLEQGIANCIHPEHYKFEILKKAEISLIRLKQLLSQNDLFDNSFGLLSDEENDSLLRNDIFYDDVMNAYVKFLHKFKMVFEFGFDCEKTVCDRALVNMNYNPDQKFKDDD